MGRSGSAGTVPEVTPAFWDDACKHLTKRDRVMKKLIPQFGEARLQSRGDAFTTLARSIVGQQISVKAAQTVWERFVAVVGGPSARLAPATVMQVSVDALRGAGLSVRCPAGEFVEQSHLRQRFGLGQPEPVLSDQLRRIVVPLAQ